MDRMREKERNRKMKKINERNDLGLEVASPRVIGVRAQSSACLPSFHVCPRTGVLVT